MTRVGRTRIGVQRLLQMGERFVRVTAPLGHQTEADVTVGHVGPEFKRLAEMRRGVVQPATRTNAERACVSLRSGTRQRSGSAGTVTGSAPGKSRMRIPVVQTLALQQYAAQFVVQVGVARGDTQRSRQTRQRSGQVALLFQRSGHGQMDRNFVRLGG
jgi:hypothetical protein